MELEEISELVKQMEAERETGERELRETVAVLQVWLSELHMLYLQVVITGGED